MSSFVDPNEVAAATLALGKLRSTRAERQTQIDEKWQTLFKQLPSELHVNITAHLDPVSQMCFGLTNRHFHTIFHEIVDHVQRWDEKRGYNIKRYPFDLRMQASVCGEYILHGWTEFYFFEDDPTLEWHRNLAHLLADETSLWKGVQRCGGCLCYKPESAWAQFELEEEIAKRHEKEIEAIAACDIQWYKSQCRRCRVKILLICLEKKMEHFKERDCPLEAEPSVGLLTSSLFDRDAADFQIDFYAEGPEKHGNSNWNAEHETWEELFEKLHI